MLQSLAVATISLVTFAAIILFYHSHLEDWVKSVRSKALLLGSMFGLGAALVMLNPLRSDQGIALDTSILFVGFAGMLAGWVGAAAALIIAVSMRIALAGGVMLAGSAVLIISALIGVMWNRYQYRITLRPPWRWAAFGGVLSLSLVGALLLPEPMRWSTLSQIGPVLVLVNVTGALLVGYMQSNASRVAAGRRRIFDESRTDELTGLLNRRGLGMDYTATLSSKPRTGVALLVLDLDNFKAINDTYGHAAGDHLLEKTTDRIGDLIRNDDIVARMGGDEFVVVFMGTTRAQAEESAERLRQTIAETPIPGSRAAPGEAHISVTVSIGAAFTRKPPEQLKDLISHADRLLYVAKERGRNCVVFEDISSLHAEAAALWQKSINRS